MPLLTVVIVTKKGNSRIFQRGNNPPYVNPKPGTFVDNTITLPER